MKASLPLKLVTIHSVLILFFMFTLSQRWLLTDIPFDCFYVPFLLVSGPLVYFVAHYAQHYFEHFFSLEVSVFLPWGVVPGLICLFLGGLQWWCIGGLWLWWRARRSHPTLLHGTSKA